MLDWKEEYEIGHIILDKERERLVKIANGAFKVVEQSLKKQKVVTVMKELNHYFHTHIKNEEGYMRSLNYPYIKQHHELHERLKEQFVTWESSLSKKSINVIEKELALHLEQTLFSHLRFEDTKISQWKKENNVELETTKWKNYYSIGNELIDKEHKHLFDIANEAFAESPKGKQKEKIKRLIHELYEYMKEHFVHEEELMESVNYPKLEEHKKIHKDIELEVHSFIKSMPTMSIDEIQTTLALFLEHWLVGHIVYEDGKIAGSLSGAEKIFDVDSGEELAH